VSGIRAFVFDIGGVLIDLDLEALGARIAGGSADALAQVRALRTHPSLREVESGRMPGEEYFRRYVQPLVPQWSYADLIAAWVEIFSPNEEGKRLFDDVRARGFPVYVLSNLARFNAEAIAIRFPGFFAETTGNLLSYELGHVKPDPAVYREACARIGRPPEACLFLDDTPDCVDGARAVGMQAIRFSSDGIGPIRATISALIGEDLSGAARERSEACHGDRV